jgi:nitrile hydratase
MTNATLGTAWFNVDQFRHAIERIEPVAYLSHGYYGRWLAAIETLLVESGAMAADELEPRVARIDRAAPPSAARPDPAIDRPAALPGERHSARPLAHLPRFGLGERVRTRPTPSVGHTRLPAYARGRLGTIVALHGGWVLPDTHAHGRGEQPNHVYTVAFDGTELWGDAGEKGTSVRIDLFEDYLLPGDRNG